MVLKLAASCGLEFEELDHGRKCESTIVVEHRAAWTAPDHRLAFQPSTERVDLHLDEAL
jgi:hypothetical protein